MRSQSQISRSRCDRAKSKFKGGIRGSSTSVRVMFSHSTWNNFYICFDFGMCMIYNSFLVGGDQCRRAGIRHIWLFQIRILHRNNPNRPPRYLFTPDLCLTAHTSKSCFCLRGNDQLTVDKKTYHLQGINTIGVPRLISCIPRFMYIWNGWGFAAPDVCIHCRHGPKNNDSFFSSVDLVSHAPRRESSSRRAWAPSSSPCEEATFSRSIPGLRSWNMESTVSSIRTIYRRNQKSLVQSLRLPKI